MNCGARREAKDVSPNPLLALVLHERFPPAANRISTDAITATVGRSTAANSPSVSRSWRSSIGVAPLRSSNMHAPLLISSKPNWTKSVKSSIFLVDKTTGRNA